MFSVVYKAKVTKKSGINPGVFDYRVLHRVADKVAPKLQKKIVAGLERFRELIPKSKLREALNSGDGGKVFSIIPWDKFSESFEDMKDDLKTVVVEVGEKSVAGLDTPNRKLKIKKAEEAGVSFDLDDPSAENWARRHSSELITGVDTESKAAVRTIIADTLASGRGFGKAAQSIIDAVGLNERQALAVDRFRVGLEAAGLKPDAVDKRTEAYRKRMLRYRAETISRTETIRAANQGNLEAWKQASEKGEFDRNDASVVWIVTPDDRLCPICAPLSGQEIKMGEKFETELGAVDAPPAHPNCRCSTALRIA